QHSKTNDTPNPISIQIQRPTQRSPDFHLSRAFVAQPIMGYTWGTPASHYLLMKQRQNRYANIKYPGGGRGPASVVIVFGCVCVCMCVCVHVCVCVCVCVCV